MGGFDTNSGFICVVVERGDLLLCPMKVDNYRRDKVFSTITFETSINVPKCLQAGTTTAGDLTPPPKRAAVR